jgi:hemerythrin-like domain-containing protein
VNVADPQFLLLFARRGYNRSRRCLVKQGGRRDLLAAVAGLAGSAALLGTSMALTGDEPAPALAVPPSEDLMREHGVHRRIILVYREAARLLHAGEAVHAGALAESVALVRRFVQGYHEKLEQEHVFPRLLAANSSVQLIATLQAQHEAGRLLTARISECATAEALAGDAGRRRMIAALDGFVRMYEPHAQREDTELIPAFRALLTFDDQTRLAGRFDEEERRALGDGGFERAVATVQQLEAAFGLGNLAHFTPELA